METRDGERLLAGRYELGDLLGSGGMAEVHSALDTRLQRPVAVKTLRTTIAARDDVRRRFDAEARAAARLSHPHAVAVFDTGEDDGTAFLVMECLPGETLADRMANGPVDPEWLRPVAIDVLGALGAAHAAGLVHRDVKPGNILLTADGSAKIGDFGIVKAVNASGLDLDITGTGQLIGTPAYLAPERIAGAPATFLSDIYSMGVVLYEALCAKKPFTGPTPISMALAIRSDDPTPLLEACPGIDPDLAAVVAKAMAKDPADRYQSAEEMAAALARTGGADPTAFALHPPVLDAAATQAIPVGATAAFAYGDIAPPPRSTPPAAPPRQSRGGIRGGRRVLPVALLVAVVAVAVVGAVVASHRGSGGTPAGSTAAAGDQGKNATLVAEVRDVAQHLAVGDGPRGAEAAQRLGPIATKLDAGDDAGPDATKLAADAAAWRSSRELGTSASAALLGVLAKVPGVVMPGSTAAPAPTPATATPVVQRSDVKKGGDRKGGGKKGKDD